MKEISLQKFCCFSFVLAGAGCQVVENISAEVGLTSKPPVQVSRPAGEVNQAPATQVNSEEKTEVDPYTYAQPAGEADPYNYAQPGLGVSSETLAEVNEEPAEEEVNQAPAEVDPYTDAQPGLGVNSEPVAEVNEEPSAEDKIEIASEEEVEIAHTDFEKKISGLLEIDIDDATFIAGYLQEANLQSSPLKALSEWCNSAYRPEDNPFREAVELQLEQAVASSEDFDLLQISPAAMSALAQYGCKTKEDLGDLDIQEFVKSDELFTAFHNLVFEGLLAADYAGLNALVVNPWRDIDLYVDGAKIGEIKKSPAEKVRKFCLPLEDNDLDGNRFVDVGIKFPTDNQGNASLRFHTSIELQKGQATSCKVSPYPAPALSIGIRAQNPTGTPVVLAGDSVILSLESPVESDLTDVVWMELGGRNTSGLQAKNVLNPPEGSSTAKGLMAWLRLRDLVQDDQNRHGDFKKRSQREMGATILNGRFDEERIIGSGQSIAWSPKVESPEIGIVALARNQNGLWGIVKRSVAVIDLRPAVWALPQTDVEIPPQSLERLSDQSGWAEAGTVELVSDILKEIQFTVPTGSPVDISLHTSPLSEAQMPVKQTLVDFGDGTPPVELADPTMVTHTWESNGDYVLTVTATGIDGISKVMSTNVTAFLQNKPEGKKPARPFVEKTPQPKKGPAESSAELFARAAKEWSQELSQAVAATLDQQKWTLEISHIHTQLKRPVVELFDGHLMTSLLNVGCQVAERDRVFTEAVEYYGSTTSQNMFGESMNNLPKLPKDLDEKIERWLLNNDNEVGSDKFFKVAQFYRENKEVDIQSELDEKIERWLLNNDNEVDGDKFVEVAEFYKENKELVTQSERDAGEPKQDRLVLAYKLSEAGVRISDVGAGLAVRECQIQGFARVIHPETKEVLFSQEIVTTISGIISKPWIPQPKSEGWNDRPSDWMLNLEPEVTWESSTSLEN